MSVLSATTPPSTGASFEKRKNSSIPNAELTQAAIKIQSATRSFQAKQKKLSAIQWINNTLIHRNSTPTNLLFDIATKNIDLPNSRLLNVVFELLIKNGANVINPNDQGKDLLHLASDDENNEVVKLIQTHLKTTFLKTLRSELTNSIKNGGVGLSIDKLLTSPISLDNVIKAYDKIILLNNNLYSCLELKQWKQRNEICPTTRKVIYSCHELDVTSEIHDLLFQKNLLESEDIYQFGMMYNKGDYVPQDFTKGREWFELAADQGHTNAQFCLGMMYYHGQGGAQDLEKAHKWYKLSADQGHADARFNLGLMYREGHGCIQNIPMALQLYELASNQDHILAQFNLGVMYYKGIGTIQNLKIASIWFKKAAAQGNTSAKFNLVVIHITQNFDYIVKQVLFAGLGFFLLYLFNENNHDNS